MFTIRITRVSKVDTTFFDNDKATKPPTSEKGGKEAS
jgi:hypothetical protein